MTEINSNFSTLHLIAIKDLRLEMNIHQGIFAQATGRSPSAWNKIENGQTGLTVDAFIGACNALRMAPTSVLNIVERLASTFNTRKVLFHTAPLDSDEDQLLPLVVRYYSSKGLETIRSGHIIAHAGVSGLTNPFMQYTVPTVVEYCTNAEFRRWVDEGSPSSSIPKSAFAVIR